MRQSRKLDQAIALGDQLAKAIEAQDFDQLDKLEANRQDHLQRFFEDDVGAQDRPALTDLLRQNDQLVEMLTSARTEVVARHQKFRSADHALSAYRQFKPPS